MKTPALLLALTLGFLSTLTVQASSSPEIPREHLVSLTTGSLDVSRHMEVPEDLSASPERPGSESYRIVKFPGPVEAAQLEALRARVEAVYTYLPHDAFLVRIEGSRDGLDDRLAATGASWHGPYHPAYKLGEGIRRLSREAAIGGERGDEPVILMIQIFPDADFEEALRRIEALGLGEVVGAKAGERFSRVRILASPAALASRQAALAGINEVFWADLEARRVLLNDTTVWVGQSGLSGGGATPIFAQGIYGEGQTVAILDTGIDADMCYFRDPSRGLPPRNECNGGTVTDPAQRKVIAVDFLWSGECSGGIGNNEWDTQDHGTHVAGTVAGDDLAGILTHDPGDGMAPGAKLVIQDGGFATDNCADLPGIGCPVVDLNPIFQQAYTQGARIHTNSWGDEENNPVKGRYTAGSQDADEFMWNHKDFLLVFAAGNDGPGTGSIGSPSTAKSVLSVGATLRASSANSMASFSSCGPTQDGRIKPDVTMPGSGIISANADNNVSSNNCNTRSSSGTSMAAPGAAGAAALIRQYYTDGWYPSGSAVPGDGFTPSAALLKATLMSSAVNMTGTAAIPGNCQGWGRVLLDDALFFSGENRELFAEDDSAGFASGSSGESRTFNFTVSGGEPLKATLAWTDFPATPLADPTLINDLDLIVTGPGGTYRGNVFSGGSSTTGGAADRLNSVEQVLIANPAAGNYTVEVRSFTVPSGPQPFALVVTGALSPPCTPAPVADAGPDKSITSGQSASIGTAAQAGHSYSWSPGGATAAEITVSPTTTTTYTLTATTACGSATDSVTVTVAGPSGCPAGTTLLHAADFESAAGGWTNDGASTCSTGDFVRGSPTQIVNGGVTTQVGGAASGTGAWFTATNSSAGVNDVDGGTCDTRSPSVSAAAGSVTVSFDYFHGQRDAGDDSTDGFVVDVLANGSVIRTIVDIGDVTSNAAWTPASATFNLASAGSLQLRVRATDGSGGGDLVEGGIDNVQICGGEGQPPGGGCAAEEEFDGGAGGWTAGAGSTCSTGSFVVGTPTQVTSSGVTTQVGGDHTSGSGGALFTAPNSSAGVNDVDGGTCIAESPTYSVTEASDLSIWYFHGQRDAGDDPSGDFFRLELSTNGGSSWSTLASFGDQTVNAAWTEATASIPAGSDVKLRVQASDGSGPGDLVEAGVDDLFICPAP